MSAFEFDCNETAAVSSANNRLKEECIIAFKVYDSCRQQDCLTSDVLGASRAAVTTTVGTEVIEAGAIIVPPINAASVSIDNLTVQNIMVSNKDENPFRNGFWDVTVKYVFNYLLTFREADNTLIGSISANSVFTKKVTLFGSVGSCIATATDLFSTGSGNYVELNSDPFVSVEAKAVALSAELEKCGCCDCDPPNQVGVSVGLFTIIKLFRLVDLSVQSRGFCIPQQCEDVSALTPCEYFDNLDFPMDIFAPPQKAEFLAGISSNIPNNNGQNQSSNSGCGCSCGCGSCGNNSASGNCGCRR